MVDRYQLFEAKAYGADVILLIAAALSKQKIHELAKVAKELQLEILFEIHDESELDKLSPLVDMVGVNNRNLKDFTVDYNRSLTLVDKIPSEFVKVSESGISDPATIGILRAAGYQGFLIGENFMRTTDPGQAAMEFIQQSSKA
jgi:indole-3-glycerol phosphate synthase